MGGHAAGSRLGAAGILEQGIEVVFWGADAGQVTIRDNSGAIDPNNNGVFGLTAPAWSSPTARADSI